MPSLGADMEEGTVVEWFVQPGDTVARGDIVATIDTDKAEIDVEIWQGGVIEALLVEVGRKVPVGTPLATLSSEGATPATPSPVAPTSEAAPAPPPAPAVPIAAPAPPPPPPVAPVAPPAPAPAAAVAGGRPRVSPLARRVATQLGVDVSTVAGSGLGGAVTKADVERAAGQPSEAAPASEGPTAPPASEAVGTPSEGADRERAASIQRAVGVAMARSHREIPHYYLDTWIDMSAAMRWLENENRQRPVRERLLYSALLLRAVALAVHEVPEVNGFWRDDRFEASGPVHLGVGVSLPDGGLIAPAIQDADQLELGELMAALRDVVQRARGGGLRGSELTSGTITVTNLGERGVDTVFGLIYPPQVALVGFGKLVERPWAEDGMVGARLQVHASLSGDHRASNGHRGALFLAAIDRLLQQPEQL